MIPLGEPMALERRGVPALALAASAVLHLGGVLAGAVLAGGGSTRPPAPRVARGAFVLAVERPAPAPRPRAVPAAGHPVEERTPSREAGASPARKPSTGPEIDLPPSLTALATEVTEHTEKVGPPSLCELSGGSRSARRPSTLVPVEAPPFADVARVAVAETEPVPSRASEGVRSARLPEGDAKPEYPAACRFGRHRAGGCEGRGTYRVEVDEAGCAVAAGVEGSAGCPDLDAAAVLFFLHRARFEPALLDGVPVPWSGTVTVRYSIVDAEATDGDSHR